MLLRPGPKYSFNNFDFIFSFRVFTMGDDMLLVKKINLRGVIFIDKVIVLFISLDNVDYN